MYRHAAFREYFFNHVSKKQNTFNTYNSYLGRIDAFIGGLDEKIAADGIEPTLAWSRQATGGPFETYPSHARSVIKRYLQFALAAESSDEELEGEEDLDEPDPVEGTVFRVEREMQAAVRKQLEMLEAGLKEKDGGAEVTVATGRIDILAEDHRGGLVVIELKAGLCPPGALEQTLGYAEALSAERGVPVRAFLVASEFPDRIRAAAKRATDLELRTYKFSMTFTPVA